MSGLGEAFVALKNVMLLHERVEGLQKEIERLTGDQKDINASLAGIDKRVVRIEALIEFTMRERPAPPPPPAIEG